MATSYVFYPGDGEQTDWTVPFQYIEQEFVHCYVDGIEVEFEWLTTNTVRVVPAVANGETLKIARETPRTPITSFSNTNNLTAESLNRSDLQALHVAEEAADRAEESIVPGDDGAFDFGGNRAKNIADPVDPGDAVNKNYMDPFLASVATYKTEAETARDVTLGYRNEAKGFRDEAEADATATGLDRAAIEALADDLSPENYLRVDDNLFSLEDPVDARFNLGLGSAATRDVTTVEGLRSNTGTNLVSVDRAWEAGEWIDLGNLSGSVVIDADTGSRFYGTLTGNVTVSFTNMKDGQDVSLAFLQDETGGWTIGWTGVSFPDDVAPPYGTDPSSKAFYGIFETGWDGTIYGNGWKAG